MIPSSIVAELALLKASVQAARPLAQASTLLKGALVSAGVTLIADIETAKTAAEPALDSSDPVGYAGDMVTSLLALSVAANDTSTLADMRGFVGRAVFNLAQA